MWDKFDSLGFGVGVSAMIPLSSVAAASNLSPRSPHSSPCGRHPSMFHSVNRSPISWITRRKWSCDDLARASTGGVPPPEAPVRTVARLELGSAVIENRNVAQHSSAMDFTMFKLNGHRNGACDDDSPPVKKTVGPASPCLHLCFGAG